MSRVQEGCREVLRRDACYLPQPKPEQLVAYFGYPQALADAPQRSVQTALAVVDRVAQLNQQTLVHHGLRVEVRVGIHTGYSDTSDVATELQKQAAPGSLVLSTATCRALNALRSVARA